MTPADRVSAHDLPLAESLLAKGVEREKYHSRPTEQVRKETQRTDKNSY